MDSLDRANAAAPEAPIMPVTDLDPRSEVSAMGGSAATPGRGSGAPGGWQ